MKGRRLVSEQARSGQSVKAFCREHGLFRPYFLVWKNRLEEETPTKFLEVRGMGRARPAIRALKSD
jgi:transposase-like protein